MNPLNDREIDDQIDQTVIDQVLTDMDPESTDSLRPLLAELRTLAHGEPVEPGPLLEALLLSDETLPHETAATAVPGGAAPVLQVIEGDGPRRPARARRRRRPLAAALVLTAAIGAGTAAAAAADEGFRSTLNDGFNSVIGVLSGHPAGVPSSPAAPAPAPAPTAPSAATPDPSSAAGSAGAGVPAPSSAATSAPRTTTDAGSASASPQASHPGLPAQLPSPNLGVPLPKLPTLPGALPQPTAPAGVPGGLH